MVGASFAQADYEYLGAEPVQERGFHEARHLLNDWSRQTSLPDVGVGTESFGYYVLFHATCPAKDGSKPVHYMQELVEADCEAVYLKKLHHDRRMMQETQSQEERWAEISRRRNGLEKQLREILQNELARVCGCERMERPLGALTEPRRDEFNGYSFEQVWSELYLKELSNMFDREWHLFQERFPGKRKKQVLRRNLEHMNSCRNDAHAKEIDDADWHYLIHCFDSLEGFVTDVRRTVHELCCERLLGRGQVAGIVGSGSRNGGSIGT